jgi:hypothetical protein
MDHQHAWARTRDGCGVRARGGAHHAEEQLGSKAQGSNPGKVRFQQRFQSIGMTIRLRQNENFSEIFRK